MKKILQHLLTDWYKYLLELIVITAGVLGAFALNSWNENRIELAQEQVILKGLKTEFEQNLVELKESHLYNKLCLDAAFELLRSNQQSTPGPTIDSLFAHIMNFATFDPRLGVVNEVISSGNLSLIRDEELRYKLTEWPAEIRNIEKDNVIRRESYGLDLIPTYNKFVSNRNTDIKMNRIENDSGRKVEQIPYDQKNYDRLLSSSEFDGALFTYYFNQKWVFNNEIQVQKFMTETLELINQQLIE